MTALPGYLFLLTFALAFVYKLRPAVIEATLVRAAKRVGRLRDLRVTVYFL